MAQIQSVKDAQVNWSQEMNQKIKHRKSSVEIMIPLAKQLNTLNSLTLTFAHDPYSKHILNSYNN